MSQPEVLAGVLGIWALIVGTALWDLSRHQVRHLPKWAWGLIIAVGSFPLGLIAYVVLGRVPAGEVVAPSQPTSDAVAAVAAVPAVAAVAAVPAVATVPAVAEEPRAAVDRAAPPVITTSGLTKRFDEVTALDAVDLRVPRGVTYGLIGPNGAGKTTLLSILAGLRRADEGSVDVAVGPGAVAVLPDTPEFEPWLSAREVVALALYLGRSRRAPDAVEAALARTGLLTAADRRVGGFSRGMLQRLGLASCLVTDPDVLVLDEPSSALDPAGRREVLDLIRHLAAERTVILSTHILGDVQRVADVVGVLDRGRLRFQGPIEQLLTQAGTAIDVTVRELSPALIAALEAAPWIERVETTAPGTVRLHVRDAGVAERELVRLLAAHDARVVSLNPATDLESAFLSLTEVTP